MTVPNADSFEVHRWYEFDNPAPVYEVIWENAVEHYDNDEDDEGEGEQSRRFATLDEALAFGKALFAADPYQCGCGHHEEYHAVDLPANVCLGAGIGDDGPACKCAGFHYPDLAAQPGAKEGEK